MCIMMVTKYLCFIALFLNSTYAFVAYPSRSSYLVGKWSMCAFDNQNDAMSYLDKLSKTNNEPDKSLKKLEGIRKHITNYMKEKKDDKQIQTGYRSTYMPIPKASFDTVFLNIFNVTIIYMSYNMDRMIFEINPTKRYVFYIKSKQDYAKINQLITMIPNKVKMIVINDVRNLMDDAFGFLYCEK